MFRSIERAAEISKAAYNRRASKLRAQLLEAQVQLREADCPVIVLFAGVDGAGKGESANLMQAWLDPHHVVTRAFGPPSDEERERPEFWRFWRDLPPKGHIGVFLSAWYHRPLLDRVHGLSDEATLEAQLDKIAAFETTLANDDTLILKYWMHLDKQGQRERFEELEADPLRRWRVTEQDWEHWRMYDQFMPTAERIIERTSAPHARWTIIDGSCTRHGGLRVGELLLEAIRAHLQRPAGQAQAADAGELDPAARPAAQAEDAPTDAAQAEDAQADAAQADAAATADAQVEDAQTNGAAAEDAAAMDERVEHAPASDSPARDARPGDAQADGASSNGAGDAASAAPTLLAQLDMDQTCDKREYQRALERRQGHLNLLHRRARDQGVSTVLVFEGWDAAGKGGAIRRVTAALDARAYRVIPIAAPTDEERSRHYLWRFWRHLSRAGRFSIFDRSWYGRVLVERVEGFASADEWGRAYDEINDFEQQLADHRIAVVKFWIHITKDEQKQRFEARLKTPHKRWKLTEEDWRNRERWGHYEQAVDEMIRRTHSDAAPWVVVEGNDKRLARLKVIESVCAALQRALA